MARVRDRLRLPHRPRDVQSCDEGHRDVRMTDTMTLGDRQYDDTSRGRHFGAREEV